MATNDVYWRHGEQDLLLVPVDSSTVIEIGDNVWLDTDDAKPASSFTWDTNLATTQEQFHDKYLGVAMQRSRSGETAPIQVARRGTYIIPCASASFNVASLVGPAKQSGNALENQKVVAVGATNLSIGRVGKQAASVTAVEVDIVSSYRGGVQTPE